MVQALNTYRIIGAREIFAGHTGAPIPEPGRDAPNFELKLAAADQSIHYVFAFIAWSGRKKGDAFATPSCVWVRGTVFRAFGMIPRQWPSGGDGSAHITFPFDLTSAPDDDVGLVSISRVQDRPGRHAEHIRRISRGAPSCHHGEESPSERK